MNGIDNEEYKCIYVGVCECKIAIRVRKTDKTFHDDQEEIAMRDRDSLKVKDMWIEGRRKNKSMRRRN